MVHEIHFISRENVKDFISKERIFGQELELHEQSMNVGNKKR